MGGASDLPLCFICLQVSTFDLLLMEVNVSLQDLTFSFSLRCDRQKHVAAFVKHFLQTLIAQDMVAS